MQILGSTRRRKPQAYARLCGRIMKPLKKDGLACREVQDGAFPWKITYAGRRKLEELNA